MLYNLILHSKTFKLIGTQLFQKVSVPLVIGIQLSKNWRAKDTKKESKTASNHLNLSEEESKWTSYIRFRRSSYWDYLIPTLVGRHIDSIPQLIESPSQTEECLWISRAKFSWSLCEKDTSSQNVIRLPSLTLIRNRDWRSTPPPKCLDEYMISF